MRIGIDLGGTKIEGIAVAEDGRERLRRRIPAPRGDYAQTLEAVVGLVRDIEREIGERADTEPSDPMPGKLRLNRI